MTKVITLLGFSVFFLLQSPTKSFAAKTATDIEYDQTKELCLKINNIPFDETIPLTMDLRYCAKNPIEFESKTMLEEAHTSKIEAWKKIFNYSVHDLVKDCLNNNTHHRDFFRKIKKYTETCISECQKITRRYSLEEKIMGYDKNCELACRGKYEKIEMYSRGYFDSFKKIENNQITNIPSGAAAAPESIKKNRLSH